MRLLNYVGGKWLPGEERGVPLVDPTLGIELARASTIGIDFGAGLEHARRAGGTELRALDYATRAALLGKIAEVLLANKKDYYEIALANSGSPEGDAAIDIEGAIFTLQYFARAGSVLGNAKMLLDAGLVKLGKDDGFQAQHMLTPVRGVAVLINAFNFPSWGLWEKAAPALLSGVPVLVKPATSTAWLTQRMVEDVVKSGVLPEGALSVVCGDAGNLLDVLTPDDLVSFTGSADTAMRLRGHTNVLRNSVRMNVEADSLNSCLLGPDVKAGSPEFELFVNEVVREMIVKAGQKCTAIRRIIVPLGLADAVTQALTALLSKTSISNPRNKDVRMGPLVNYQQLASAQEGLSRLKQDTRVLLDGGAPSFKLVDADPSVGAFLAPTLLYCANPLNASHVHNVEVFGPVATLLPYKTRDEAIVLARRSQGSLVASVFSDDADFLSVAALELANIHGRVLAVNTDVGASQTGHGNVMPMCLHGGPGRTGGGEELGGLRALGFYHRRSVIQGPVNVLSKVGVSATTFNI